MCDRDNIVDGALYKELPTTTKMSQGAHLGILLDLDTKRLEFYVDKARRSQLFTSTDGSRRCW